MSLKIAIKIRALNLLKFRVSRMQGLKKDTTVTEGTSGLLIVRAGGDGVDALSEALAQVKPEKPTLQ